jgi:hypothetical protein
MMLRVVPLLVGLMVAGGCARMEPYQARDEREEGPKKGLFSGSEGEFVIFTRKAEPVADNKKKKKN